MTRGPRCLPFAKWPALDQELWLAGTRSAGLFEVQGAGAAWAAPSRRKTEQGYGAWLTWLGQAGSLDVSAHPADRVTRERVHAYMTRLTEVYAPYTQVNRAQELYDAMRVLAPDRDWTWLRRLMATLAARAHPVTNKRPRLRPAGELRALGEQLMAEADADPTLPEIERAMMFRDGMMVALLASRPMRKRNFCALRIGVHLIATGGGYWLRLAADETKTGRPYDGPVPASLVDFLERYLSHHRRVLLRSCRRPALAATDQLWVSRRGTPMTRRSGANPIVKRTRAAFGQSVPPHWFRDAAATTIAIEDPAHVRDAHLILGHASLTTTEKHYNQARSLDASRRHLALLESLRRMPRTTPASEDD